MKPNQTLTFFVTLTFLLLLSCEQKRTGQQSSLEAVPSAVGQSAVADNESQKDVVRVAISSADHTTLVAALKAAAYVDALSNAGPFTVFAPTNAAFEKLPSGTVEDLLRSDKMNDLRNILEYHVAVGVYKLEFLSDGQNINEVNLENVTIGVKDGKYTVNGAKIIATVPASNGIVYVVDAVLLPPAK